MTPHAVERRLTAVLAGWAVASVLAGAVLARSPGTRSFGRQTVLWGLTDAAIAGIGAARGARGRSASPDRLRRVLLVNAVLDAGYVVAGLALLRPPVQLARRPAPGSAAAVVVQGVFLLGLDTWAARRLRPGPQPGGACAGRYDGRVAAR